MSVSSPVEQVLAALHARYAALNDGAAATYIPELAKADPRHFGLALCMGDGFVCTAGEADVPFTVQSISKAVVYGLALQDHGRAGVRARIGVEPSGDPFNAIEFDRRTNRPFNPMVNAGAIAATALVKGADPAERMGRIVAAFEAFTGRMPALDEAVYRSEHATGHRNRAIAWLELNAGVIGGDVDAHLDLYFRQCSLLVTARDLAVMAATLAHGGVNPVTGRRALDSEHVRDVLSVMATSGMYDYAGAWFFDVGLPAKSGVGGGIAAALPAQLGIGAYAPLLDGNGNSLRGIRACEDLARELKLHLLDHRGGMRPALRHTYRGSEVRSKRVRRASMAAKLDRIGRAIIVHEIQGALSFASADMLTRHVLTASDGATRIVLDGSRLTSLDAVAADLLDRLAAILAADRRQLQLVLPAGPDIVLPPVLAAAGGVGSDVDALLEAGEQALLGEAADAHGPLDLAEVDVVRDLDPADRARLQPHLVSVAFAAGQHLVREGEQADRLFLLTAGYVNVLVQVGAGEARRRIGTIEAGGIVGETALFGAGERTADVVAGNPVQGYALSRDAFAALGQSDAALQARLLVVVGASLATRLRRANAEIRALAR